ncbi:MAG: DUF6314 family protein [Bacteroidota bacterium]
MTAAEVLSRLAKATRAEVTVRSEAGVGHGHGLASASWTDGSLVLAVEGTWTPAGATPAGARPVRWRSASRWRDQEGDIALAWQRQDVDATVDLVRQRDQRWASRSPFDCPPDLYAAALQVASGRVTVVWTISGPAKQATVETVYT